MDNDFIVEKACDLWHIGTRNVRRGYRLKKVELRQQLKQRGITIAVICLVVFIINRVCAIPIFKRIAAATELQINFLQFNRTITTVYIQTVGRDRNKWAETRNHKISLQISNI